MIPALLIVTVMVGGMHHPGEPSPIGMRHVGAAVGGVGGAVVGGVGAFFLWVTALDAAVKADGCQDEECEGYGLAYFFYTIPVVVIGAGLGAGAGGGAGYVVGASATTQNSAEVQAYVACALPGGTSPPATDG